ncbi:MAG TPA: prephenate dehydrogenase/arogenate dehydrogenase family protein [Solirubrobacteraceae bacterium]|nr:prephenate dehydrogenase/arogenate dehydrogenase family protein [Solirubrobacteraceae bacterium]
MNVAIVGVGLVGGSIGLAARERLGAEVAGFDTAPEPLQAALERGAVDRAAPDLRAALDGAEAAFVAAPVGALPAAISAVLAVAPEDCVVTDVGSTKRTIVDGIDDERFIGGHPLAGAAAAGVRHARAELFDGATWYLTPTPATRGTLYERLHRMLSALGARPAAIDAETHDRLLATVSHLPHVLANVLVAQAASALSDEKLPATGPSFRDVTRVAGSNTTIWRDIYLSNADSLIAAIDDAIDRLGGVRAALAAGDGDAIAAWNDSARTDRRRLLEADLAGGEVCELRVAVPNRPGIVAEVALALGRGGVNISDMALHPAPDRSSGFIVLWIAGAERAAEAEALVAALGLPVARA